MTDKCADTAQLIICYTRLFHAQQHQPMIRHQVDLDRCDTYEELELLRRLFHGVHAVAEVVVTRAGDAAVMQVAHARLRDV